MSENAPYNPSDSYPDDPFSRNGPLPWESASNKPEKGNLPWETADSQTEADNESEKDPFSEHGIETEDHVEVNGLNIEFGKIPDKGYVLKIPGGGLLPIGTDRADAYTLFDLAVSQAGTVAGDTPKERGSAVADILEPYVEQILESTEEERYDTPTEKLTTFEALKNRMSESGSTFMSKLRGEHVPDTSQEPEPGKKDAAKYYSLISKGVLSGLATMTGIKGAYDVPAWFYQKYVTTAEEKNRIKDAFSYRITEEGEKSAFGEKIGSLTSTIDESRFLSPEQKTELKNKVQEIAKRHEEETMWLERTSAQDIYKLVDEYIQTRVQGTIALKEGVNSALKFTAAISGASVALALGRSGTYLTVSLFERAKKVQKEMKEGEREGKFLKEYMKGFGETWDNLNGGKGKDWKEKSVNIAKAAGTITRAAGFGFLAGSAIGESIPDGTFDKLLLSIPTGKEVAEGLVGGDVVNEAVEGSAAEAMDQEAVTDEAVAEPLAVTETEEALEESEPEEEAEAVAAPTPEIPTEEFEEGVVNVPPGEINSIEESQLELATIKSGDGIIRIAQRQLEADPAGFGYDGDMNDASAVKKWVRKTAFAASKQAGFVQSNGWTGLSGKGIDKVAIVLSNNDGKIDFNFVDSHTGDALDMDELKDQNIIHDYIKPVVEPTEKLPLIEGVYEAPAEAVAVSPAPEPEVVIPEAVVNEAAEVPVQPEAEVDVPEGSAEVAAAAEPEVSVDSKSFTGEPDDAPSGDQAKALDTASAAVEASPGAAVDAPVLNASDSVAEHAGAAAQTSDSRGWVVDKDTHEAAPVDKVEKLGALSIERDGDHIPKVSTAKESVVFIYKGGNVYPQDPVSSPLSPNEQSAMIKRFGTNSAEFKKLFNKGDSHDLNDLFRKISAFEHLKYEMEINGLEDTPEHESLDRTLQWYEQHTKGGIESLREDLAEAADSALRAEFGDLADQLAPQVPDHDVTDKVAFADYLSKHGVSKQDIPFLVRAVDGNMEGLAWMMDQNDADRAVLANLDTSIPKNAEAAKLIQQRIESFDNDIAGAVRKYATEEKALQGDAHRNLNDMAARIEDVKLPDSPAETPDVAEAVVTKSGDVEIARAANGGIESVQLTNNADDMELKFNRSPDGKLAGFSYDGKLTDFDGSRIKSVLGESGFTQADVATNNNVETAHVMKVGFLKEMSNKLVSQGLQNSAENLALERYVSAQENLIASALSDPTLVVPELTQGTTVDMSGINKMVAKMTKTS